MHTKSNLRRTSFPPRKKRQQGVAAVEFALVLVPLLIIAFGAVEYGRAIYHYNTLVKSTRSAVRWASLAPATSPGYATFVSQAKCLAVHGNTACDGSPLASGLTLANVKLCDQSNWAECTGATQGAYQQVPLTGGSNMNLVAVRISGYTYSFLGLPLVTPSSSVTFGDIEAVMYQ